MTTQAQDKQIEALYSAGAGPRKPGEGRREWNMMLFTVSLPTADGSVTVCRLMRAVYGLPCVMPLELWTIAQDGNYEIVRHYKDAANPLTFYGYNKRGEEIKG